MTSLAKRRKYEKPLLALLVASVALLSGCAKTMQLNDPALSDRLYLTNVLREEAVKRLPAEDDYTIMTRENTSAMLPPGRALEDCEGSCLAEMGRNIYADFVC